MKMVFFIKVSDTLQVKATSVQSQSLKHSSDGDTSVQSQSSEYTLQTKITFQSQSPRHSSDGDTSVQSQSPEYTLQTKVTFQSQSPKHSSNDRHSYLKSITLNRKKKN